jgi:hypothetical protein
VFDPYAGLPPHVKAAVEASGGLTSEVGKSVYKTLTGRDVPATPVAAPKPVDPFEGQPPHVKMAVEGAGGLATTAGQQVYKGLTGKDAPNKGSPEAPQPEAKPARKTRSAGKATPPPPPVTSAPQAVAPATPAVPSFATPPATASGGLGSDIEALLSSAMNVPTK